MNTSDNPFIRPRKPFEKRVVQAIAGAKPRMSVGIAEKPLPGGTSLQPIHRRSQRRRYGRWNPTFISATELSVDVGTICDGVTTYIPDGSSVTTHASSLNYVYLECDLTPALEDGYVSGGTIDGAIIAAYTTAKTTTNTKGYVLLFTCQAGALVNRGAEWSMQAELLNSGTGDVVFRTWVSS